MLKRFKTFAIMAIISLIAAAASAGAGLRCYWSFYQPEPPEELRR